MIKEFTDISMLDNETIENRLLYLKEREHESTVYLLVYLSEYEKRGLCNAQSAYSYLRDKLKYSEGAAYRRLKASRCISKYPEVLKLLKEQRVNLSTICEFSNYLSQFNKAKLLEEVLDKSKTEVISVIAKYQSAQKAKKERVQTIKTVVKKEPLPLFSNEKAKAIQKVEQEPKKPEPKEQEYEIRKSLNFSVSECCYKKLEYVKELLSNKYPQGASLEQILEEGADSLIDKLCPIKKAKKRAKRKLRKKSNKKVSRNKRIKLSESVKAEVYEKCNNQCTFVDDEGNRCTSRWQLEIDHIKPLAKGGSNEVENLRLLCARHNNLEARREFGDAYIDKKISKKK